MANPFATMFLKAGIKGLKKKGATKTVKSKVGVTGGGINKAAKKKSSSAGKEIKKDFAEPTTSKKMLDSGIAKSDKKVVSPLKESTTGRFKREIREMTEAIRIRRIPRSKNLTDAELANKYTHMSISALQERIGIKEVTISKIAKSGKEANQKAKNLSKAK